MCEGWVTRLGACLCYLFNCARFFARAKFVRCTNCAPCFSKDNPTKKSITGSIAKAAVRDIADASVMDPNGNLVGH